MEDGAKENTALNIQKPLEILVTDEDKHGTDIACMSDFFGIYIEQLSAELSNQVMRGVVEKIPAADVQILGELVHGVDVLLSGKYGYIPDFDSLPNDVKDKLKKGIYTLGESRQVEDNVRAVVLDENGTRIKDVTLKRVLNTPDVVYVTTPNRSHAEISIAAMEAGRDVMCEKPMAKNYAEAQKMVETAERTHRVLNIGYQNRYRTDSLYLKEMCKSDELGEIYFAKAHALRRRAVPTWGVFLNEEEQGGGPLIDIGTHALDLTLWMMDNYEVQSVTGASFHKLSDQTDQGNAFGNWDPDKFCVEDSAFGFIRMKNGAVIELESAWALNTLEVDEAKTSLCGTKAGADMKDGLRINYIHHNTQVVEKPELSSGGVAFFSGKEKSAADYEQELFYHIVVDGAEQVVKPAQAAVVTRILEAIYQSAESGKTIYFE